MPSSASLSTCPSLCSLLKFQEKGENGRETYDEYRDEAGKLVLAKGGHLAFLGDVKASCDFCGPLLEHIVRAHAQHRDEAIKWNLEEAGHLALLSGVKASSEPSLAAAWTHLNGTRCSSSVARVACCLVQMLDSHACASPSRVSTSLVCPAVKRAWELG